MGLGHKGESRCVGQNERFMIEMVGSQKKERDKSKSWIFLPLEPYTKKVDISPFHGTNT